MIRLIRYVLITISFLVSCGLGLLYGILRPFNPTNSRWCSRTFSFLGLPVIGMRLKVEGFENYPADRNFIVVANHQSNWDLFTVGAAIPDRTVSIGKKSLKWVPLFGQLYWLSGNLLVDRGNPAKAVAAMAKTKEALTEKNTNIWFFAEGTRNHGKNMLPFKKGAFITAINAGVPIVPVCCSPYLDGFSWDKLNNGTAKVQVLPPIETKGLNKKDVKELMLKCRSSMMESINSLDQKDTNKS